MTLLRHIHTVLLILLGTLLLPATASSNTLDTEMCSTHSVVSEKTESHAPESNEPAFSASSITVLSTAPTTVTVPNVVPIIRTLSRTSLSAERMFQYSKAVSSIDTTTAASRYGLYNHKILFVSLARIYYLNRLMRLII